MPSSHAFVRVIHIDFSPQRYRGFYKKRKNFVFLCLTLRFEIHIFHFIPALLSPIILKLIGRSVQKAFKILAGNNDKEVKMVCGVMPDLRGCRGRSAGVCPGSGIC